MASSFRRSKSVGQKRVESRLVDTNSKSAHHLEEGGRLLIVSHAHLESLDGYDHAHKTLQLPPTFDKDVYCLEIFVQSGRTTGLVCVHKGVCYVNGEEMRDGAKPRKMKSGTFLDLGASYQFQFLAAKVSDDSPTKRVLPRTPGQPTNEMPPSKPPRHHLARSMTESTDSASYASTSYTGSIDMKQTAIDEGLRVALKRIAKEIESRKSGYQDRKPPPPYEQAGNSIGYQLLHQKHSDVTTGLLNRLYPALKELESKDPELSNDYSSFVAKYDEAREAGATPQCMMPGDIPTINFIADVVVNLCCMPNMVSLSEKLAPFFAHVLAIFSSSHQNQVAMAEQRHTTKILSCMNLTIMANIIAFQQHGWTLLANTLAIPTLAGKKPLLSEASLTLALGLIENQLNDYSLELDLSLAIIKFLSVVASTAKHCTLPASGRDEAPPIYTPTQASSIIKLLNDTKILRHVMKVSQGIRSDPNFDQHYAVVVKCLAPTRSKRKGILTRRVTSADILDAPPIATTPPYNKSPSVPNASIPPPKPKRRFRNRCSTLGTQSNGISDIATKVRMKTERTGYLSSSLTVANGHMTSSGDHMTLSETVSPPSNKEDHTETDMKSVSEVSSESDLKTASCSALTEQRDEEESESELLQSTSAPALPQREMKTSIRIERAQEEPTKPEMLLQEPAKPEHLQEEPTKPERVVEEPVKQESPQEEPVKPEMLQEEPVEQKSLQEEPVKPALLQEEPTKSELLLEEPVKQESPQDIQESHGEEPVKHDYVPDEPIKQEHVQEEPVKQDYVQEECIKEDLEDLVQPEEQEKPVQPVLLLVEHDEDDLAENKPDHSQHQVEPVEHASYQDDPVKLGSLEEAELGREDSLLVIPVKADDQNTSEESLQVKTVKSEDLDTSKEVDGSESCVEGMEKDAKTVLGEQDELVKPESSQGGEEKENDKPESPLVSQDELVKAEVVEREREDTQVKEEIVLEEKKGEEPNMLVEGEGTVSREEDKDKSDITSVSDDITSVSDDITSIDDDVTKISDDITRVKDQDELSSGQQDSEEVADEPVKEREELTAEKEKSTVDIADRTSVLLVTEEANSKENVDFKTASNEEQEVDVSPPNSAGPARSSESGEREEKEQTDTAAVDMVEKSKSVDKDKNESSSHSVTDETSSLHDGPSSLHDGPSSVVKEGESEGGASEAVSEVSGGSPDRKPHLPTTETHPQDPIPEVKDCPPLLVAEDTPTGPIDKPHPPPDEPYPSSSEPHSASTPQLHVETENLEQPHPSADEPHPSINEPHLPREPSLPTTAHDSSSSSKAEPEMEEREQTISQLATPMLSPSASQVTHLLNEPSQTIEPCALTAGEPVEGQRSDEVEGQSTDLIDPPWSPDATSLANDIENLLSSVQAPLEEEQVVRVPTISRHSRYYRVSVKGSTPKSSRRGQDGERDTESTTPSGEESPSYRPRWGVATPPSALRGHAEASPFEVSGEFLSTTHHAIEDITSGHQDMKETLEGRLEVSTGVLGLWRRNKGLQAATNLVQACFSNGRDIVLFVDIIRHFLSHQSPWTLAVCFVLLPVLRQLLTTQSDERCVSVVCDVVHMIVNRFSELILFSKGKSRAHTSRRLSSTIDREQQEVCYNELHDIRQSLHHRLDVNSDPTAVANVLRKLHASLKPFRDPLDDVHV